MKSYIKPPRLSTAFSRRASDIKRRFENILDTSAKRAGLAAITAAAAITICAGGCFARQVEPVFLTHYYDIPSATNGANIILTYVTSRSDRREATSVEFPECPEFSVTLGNVYDRAYFNRKLSDMLLVSATDSEPSFGPSEITTARVTFSDGTTSDFNIGRIIVGNAPPTSILAEQGVHGSNDGKSGVDKLALKDCVLTDITSNFTENIGAKVRVSINGNEDYALPMELHKGDIISFGADITVDDAHKTDAYNLNSTLVLTDSDGRTVHDYIRNIRYEPYITFSDIQRILKK